ncbi:MAG: sirohydrochlorin cobaltochelatase [Eubacterium sp.]|nr:sirohydrochlorin cobaltochelatase [Eubacterium sp.]
MKQGIVLVSHGTLDQDIRLRTIDDFMLSVGDRLPDAEIVCAFTNSDVRRMLRETKGERVQNVKAAMLSMKEMGVTDLTVVTTDILEDEEHKKIREEIGGLAAFFNEVKVSKPLLSEGADFEVTARAVHGAFGEIVGDDVLILITKGSKELGDEKLSTFERSLKKHFQKGYVASLKGEKRLYKIIKELKSIGIEDGRIVLVPMEFIAGPSIENEISDCFAELSERLLQDGYVVEEHFKGLGEYDAFQRLYLRHLYDA